MTMGRVATGWRARLSSLSAAAVAAAFVLGGILLALAGADPFQAYADMLSGTFDSRFDPLLWLK